MWWLLADGRITGRTVPAAPTLNALRRAVGGYIEVVLTPVGPLVVNEEGRQQGLPLNLNASTLARQPIVGDAVWLAGFTTNPAGEWVPVDEFSSQGWIRE